MKYIPQIVMALAAAVSLSNCALGTTKINVSHSPLQPVVSKHSGTIVVKQFTDSRKVEDKASIGNKRNGFGMVLGGFAIKGGKSVAQTMTEYVADALKEAGYNAVVEGSGTAPGAAVLEGDVYEFWLDLFTATWHNVGVDLKLRNRSGTVAWQKRINGSETNVLWIGLNAEIEKVIRQAVDKALNAAAKEFASEEFASKAK
jgi:hypothetical protein